MIFIPIQHLQPGMILSKDINLNRANKFNLPLLTKGQILTKEYIQRITKYNIRGVYVESEVAEDIVIKETIDDKLKNRTLCDIKEVFDDFATNRSVLDTAKAGRILSTAKDLVNNILSNKENMVNLSDLKSYDDYTYYHSLCVAVLSISTGVAMGLKSNTLNEIAISGLLHDIGKMIIPLDILNKPSKLTEEEFAIIMKHPSAAVEQLRKRHLFPAIVTNAIESHHERYDGTGYPNGVSGKKIPLFGRILAVCDVYDALTSNRPYRKQLFPSEAIEYMMGNAGTHFDHEILTAFLKTVAAYPVGTFVSLSHGKKAIVIKNQPNNTLRPIVRLINEDGSSGEEIDLFSDPKYMQTTIIGIAYDDKELSCGHLAKKGVIHTN